MSNWYNVVQYLGSIYFSLVRYQFHELSRSAPVFHICGAMHAGIGGNSPNMAAPMDDCKQVIQ